MRGHSTTFSFTLNQTLSQLYVWGISGYIWGTFDFANQSNLNAIDWANTPNSWEHCVFGKNLISLVSIQSDNVVYQYFPKERKGPFDVMKYSC